MRYCFLKYRNTGSVHIILINLHFDLHIAFHNDMTTLFFEKRYTIKGISSKLYILLQKRGIFYCFKQILNILECIMYLVVNFVHNSLFHNDITIFHLHFVYLSIFLVTAKIRFVNE